MCKRGQYAERRAKGLCGVCGKHTPTVLPDGTQMATCDECREKCARYKKNYRTRKKSILLKETNDAVETVMGKLAKCKSCGININAAYYYCPWCGAQIAIEEVGKQ